MTVTIFADSVSKKNFAKFQTSTSSALTIQSKLQMEKEAKCFNVTIKHIKADNSIFCSKEFQDHIESLEQDITFCGVSAHHQNGIAECHIRILVESTCTIDLWNNTLQKDLWYFTLEKGFAGNTNRITSKRDTLHHFHPFNCPVYVVDPAIADGRKIPKWDPHSRVGIYLGRFCDHADSVAWILNPCTDHISAQFHTIFDDTFST
eukprot:13392032-Ditylum_brightwellii.AAC.1